MIKQEKAFSKLDVKQVERSSLKSVRNTAKPKEWWNTLNSKLRGDFQYYGVSGNHEGINAFYKHIVRVLHKCLNGRNQKRGMNWKNFSKYPVCYSIPKPKVVNNFYT